MRAGFKVYDSDTHIRPSADTLENPRAEAAASISRN